MTLLAACSTPEVAAPPEPPPVTDPPGPSFEADPRPASPALWLEGALDGEILDVEIWGAASAAFGVAATLEVDPEHLVVETAALDDETTGGAATILTTDEGSVAFGIAARRLEDAPLDGRLATIKLKAVGGSAALTLERVMVRTVDGAFVPVTVAGARYGAGGDS